MSERIPLSIDCNTCQGQGKVLYPSNAEYETNPEWVTGVCDECRGSGIKRLVAEHLEALLLQAWQEIDWLRFRAQSNKQIPVDDRVPHRVDPSVAPRVTPEFLPASRVDPADVPKITQEHVDEALKPFHDNPTFVQMWLANHSR